MIKVKINGAELPIIMQAKEGQIWGNCQFFWNDNTIQECDYWFIFDSYGLENDNVAVCPKENIYLVMGEAEGIKTYKDDFVKQFYNIVTVQRGKYNYVPRIYYKYVAPWFVGFKFTDNGADKCHYKSYELLKSMKKYDVKKTKLLSIISSNKQMNNGHRMRLKFAYMVKEYFGDQVDFFGRGINEFADKWDVLAPYKYHIAIENYVCDDYITEKFYDPVLAVTYPIYYGAGNINKYFHENAYSQIDIFKPDEALKKIEKIITSNIYEQYYEYLWEARELTLDKYNVFNMLSELIKENNYSSKKCKEHKLFSEASFKVHFRQKIKQIWAKHFCKED